MRRTFQWVLAAFTLIVGGSALGAPALPASAPAERMCTAICRSRTGCMLCGGGCTDQGNTEVVTCTYSCTGTCINPST